MNRISLFIKNILGRDDPDQKSSRGPEPPKKPWERLKETELGLMFSKMENRKPHFAIVDLEVEETNSDNEIIERYSGQGFISQGHIESVPENGYDDWKIAARNGLEFIMRRTGRNWKVRIKSISGLVATDTNPTIVGYVTILAFCSKIKFELETKEQERLDNFLFNSWKQENTHFDIPDFENLTYIKVFD